MNGDTLLKFNFYYFQPVIIDGSLTGSSRCPRLGSQVSALICVLAADSSTPDFTLASPIAVSSIVRKDAAKSKQMTLSMFNKLSVCQYICANIGDCTDCSHNISFDGL